MSRPEHKTPHDLLHRILEGEPLSPLEREQVRARVREPQTAEAMRHWRETMEQLKHLPRVEAPPGFAQDLAQRIATQAQAEQALEALSHQSVLAPPDFAARMAARIHAEAEESAHPEVVPALRSLPRLSAPPQIASTLAARIARESVGLEEHNPAPLYLVGGILLAAGVGVASYAWPYIGSGGQVLLELVRGLPPASLIAYALVLLLSLGVFLMSRMARGGVLRPVWQFSGAGAFALVLALTVPTFGPYFGSVTLESGQTRSSLLRLGGDVTVAGRVEGNVIALGGNVRLERDAEVGGQVISVLGSVRLSEQHGDLLEQGRVTPLLGSVEGVMLAQPKPDLPGVGAAAAFQPLLELSRSEQWPLLHLGLLSVFALLMFQSNLMPRLSSLLRREGLRALSSGMFALGVGLPAILLLSLSPISSGLAVIALVGLLALTSAGLALSLTRLGISLSHIGGLGQRLAHIPLAREGVQVALGLGLFALTLPFPMVATLAWALGGALGLGTLGLFLLERVRGQV